MYLNLHVDVSRLLVTSISTVAVDVEITSRHLGYLPLCFTQHSCTCNPHKRMQAACRVQDGCRAVICSSAMAF